MAQFSPVLFFRQVRQEISKVTWPTRKEAMMSSVMVIILSAIAAVFLFLIDSVFAYGIKSILTLGG